MVYSTGFVSGQKVLHLASCRDQHNINVQNKIVSLSFHCFVNGEQVTQSVLLSPKIHTQSLFAKTELFFKSLKIMFFMLSFFLFLLCFIVLVSCFLT